MRRVLRWFGFRWGYIEMPKGAKLDGPLRIEGYNMKLIGTTTLDTTGHHFRANRFAGPGRE